MPQWKLWLEGSESARFLWIHGIPGAGKTILASFLIRLCQDHCVATANDTACVYYYCSYQNNQDEALPLLRWVVGQLCRNTGQIPKGIHDIHHLSQQPDMDLLLDALDILLSGMKTVYIVVDAVDESMPRADLLELIERLVTDVRFQKVQVLATSRNYFDIETVLSRLSTSISMSNDEVDKDIRVYAKAEIDRKCSSWGPELKSEVLEALVLGAKGM